LDTLLRHLDEAPVTVTTKSGSTRLIDNVAFVHLLLDALAHPDGSEALPPAVGMATAGRMAEAVAALEGMTTGGRAIGDTLSEGAQLSSECADVIPLNKADPTVETRPLLRAVAGLEAKVRQLCLIWDVPAAPQVGEPDSLPKSDVLVLSGHLDPITPSTWARRLAADLDGAILVESNSWSHAPSLADPCAENLVARFLDGSRPEPGIAPC
jgi:pimeloyl-ACP methyl ester carboxylesterase